MASEDVVGREALERALLGYVSDLLLLVDLDGRLRVRLGATPLGYEDMCRDKRSHRAAGESSS